MKPVLEYVLLGFAIVVGAACITTVSCTPAELQKLQGFERGVDQTTELCVKAATCFGVPDVAKACGITDTVLHGIQAAQEIVCPIPDAGRDQ